MGRDFAIGVVALLTLIGMYRRSVLTWAVWPTSVLGRSIQYAVEPVSVVGPVRRAVAPVSAAKPVHRAVEPVFSAADPYPAVEPVRGAVEPVFSVADP